MNIVRNHINEKFTENSDPIHDMGIGLLAKRNFDNSDEASEFLLRIIPYLLHTNEIPDDILIFFNHPDPAFKWNYYWELKHYCKKYISINNIKNEFFGSLYNDLRNKLLNLGYPKINITSNLYTNDPYSKYLYEKFTEEGDPIHDMGIGLEKIIKDWFLSKGASSESYDRYVSYDKNYLINLDCYLSLQKGWLKNGQLPEFINFGTINANFYANNCGLKTMRGFPKIIKGSFTCNENYIKSLEYCPKYVKLDFEMIDNSVSFSTRQIKKVCDVGCKIIL